MSSVTRDINELLDQLPQAAGEQEAQEIVDQLNKLTNQGKSIRDLFTNQYYVNDPGEDKRCADKHKESFV